MPNPTTMHMEKTKETKGTVVFTETIRDGQTLTDERPHTFYVLKDTFAELGGPEELEVVLEAS